MDDKKNTSVRKSAFTAKRVAVGAASLAAATALVGVGAQGAFATTIDGGASGSGWGTHATARAWASADTQHQLFAGHFTGQRAQQIAKRVVADKALFSLLPDALQKDVTALAQAPANERVADAKKIVTTALDGGYGTAIKDLATHLKDARSHESAKSEASESHDGKDSSTGSATASGSSGASGSQESSDPQESSHSHEAFGLSGLAGLKGVIDELRDGNFSSPALGTDGAAVAKEVTGDTTLAAKLPASLRSDLSELAIAPSSERTGDVQKIAATALAGGYGADIQQLAQQVEQHLESGH